jgi:hypothetical protein
LGASDHQGRFCAALTGDDGSFDIVVVGGQWYVQLAPEEITQRGLLANELPLWIVDGAHQTNLLFAIEPVTAQLQGQAQDSAGLPLKNVAVQASDSLGRYLFIYTDANGRFHFGVTAGTWQVELDSSAATRFGLVSSRLTLNVTNGMNLTDLFCLTQSGTAHITGSVVDEQANPVLQIQVTAHFILAGAAYYAAANTDSTGSFTLLVFNGDWIVGVSGPDLEQRGYQKVASQMVEILDEDGTAHFLALKRGPPAQPVLWAPARRPDGRFQFWLRGETGRQYRIDASTNLITWSALTNMSAAANELSYSDPESPQVGRRFYRAVVVEP